MIRRLCKNWLRCKMVGITCTHMVPHYEIPDICNTLCDRWEHFLSGECAQEEGTICKEVEIEEEDVCEVDGMQKQD